MPINVSTSTTVAAQPSVTYDKWAIRSITIDIVELTKPKIQITATMTKTDGNVFSYKPGDTIQFKILDLLTYAGTDSNKLVRIQSIEDCLLTLLTTYMTEKNLI